MNHGLTISSLVQQSRYIRQISRGSLDPGDMMIVKTVNSVYKIRIIDNGYCRVSGGWFEKQGLSSANTRIVGCTWGGSAIKVDVLAACGLCLEFGNRLVTSAIQKIFVIRTCSLN